MGHPCVIINIQWDDGIGTWQREGRQEGRESVGSTRMDINTLSIGGDDDIMYIISIKWCKIYGNYGSIIPRCKFVLALSNHHQLGQSR